MGMVSVAEAALESQVRPEIMLVRERTSYPRRPVRSRPPVAGNAVGNGSDHGTVRGAVRGAVPAAARPEDAAAGSGEVPALRPGLFTRQVESAGDVSLSVSQATPVAARASRKPMSGEAVPAPRMRLTRRGKVVVGVLVGAAVILVAVFIWIMAAARAQAASQASASSSGRQGMIRVVARPGQSLWAIAVRIDPSADPRIVVQQIMTDNDLSVPSIRAGQVLWVPRI